MTVPEGDPAVPPSWGTGREALALWFARTTLRKTLKIAAIVGTLLSLANQGSVIATGDASAATWLRVGFNYFVPFCVSSTGFLSATRRRA
jgi:hypothetical protein